MNYILIFIVIIISCLLFFKKKTNIINYNGVCAFDIDGTSLQGIKNVCIYKNNYYDETNGGCTRAAIEACKDKNYAIAVNTASNRDKQKYCCQTGFCIRDKCIIEDDNWWNNQKYYSKNYNTSNHGGCGKTIILDKLKKKYNIKNKKNIILFDDYHANITGASNSGFGVIPMNNLLNCSDPLCKNNCGINQIHINKLIDNDLDFIPCDNFKNQKCNLEITK